MIVVWNGDKKTLNLLFFLCYSFWLTYNIFVFSVVGIISNIISLISTYIAYYNFKQKRFDNMFEYSKNNFIKFISNSYDLKDDKVRHKLNHIATLGIKLLFENNLIRSFVEFDKYEPRFKKSF